METEHERRHLSVLNSHQKLRSAQCVLRILCFSVALLSTFLNLIAVTSKCGWRSTVLETTSKDCTFQPTTAANKALACDGLMDDSVNQLLSPLFCIGAGQNLNLSVTGLCLNLAPPIRPSCKIPQAQVFNPDKNSKECSRVKVYCKNTILGEEFPNASQQEGPRSESSVWPGAFCVQFGRSPFVSMYWCDCECEWLSLLGLQQTGDLFRVSP